MYTEDTEFDYNELVEDDKFNSKKTFFNKGLILKILIILICLLLVMFIVFKLKNSSSKPNNNDNDNDSITNQALVFNNNLELLRETAEHYFFEDNNLPKEVGDSLTINVSSLITNELITEVVDHEGNSCGYNTSYMTVTKNQNDYKLEINLVCPSMRDSVVYYYDLDKTCLTCNGENYEPVVDLEDDNKEENTDAENNQDESNQEENNNDSANDNEEDNNNSSVCGVFTEWTDTYIDDDRFDVETRVVVQGVKEITTYGPWSEPTKTKIEETDNLEVKKETKEEKTTTKTAWSKESTTKPKSKSGREISSRSVKKAYTTTSCTGGGKYTKTLTYCDDAADSCVRKSITEVVNTYTSKKTCKDVTNYKTVTYYKYRDTVTKTVKTTYYSSRVINKNTEIFTDFVLENELPEGYKVLAGSGKTQYRYSLKCESGK